jgi:heat shock protein HtpX
MATTYDFVAANKRRSIVLVGAFILVIGLVGWALSYAYEAGPAGVVFAVAFAVTMSLVGYFSGDKIALISSGAKGPIAKDDNPYLYRMVENLCIASGLPLPKIYLLEAPQINAFATGRDPQHASIAVSRGALERLENEELEGVLAHELSHVKNYDVRFMTLVITMVGILALLSDFFWRARLFGGGRSNNNDRGGGQAQGIFMIVGLVLLIFAPLIGRLIQFAVSRKREFLADASGALLTRYPEGLARALEKIDQANVAPMPGAHGATAHLYISNPFGRNGSISKMFSTHPPIAERVTALRKMGSLPST